MTMISKNKVFDGGGATYLYTFSGAKKVVVMAETDEHNSVLSS